MEQDESLYNHLTLIFSYLQWNQLQVCSGRYIKLFHFQFHYAIHENREPKLEQKQLDKNEAEERLSDWLGEKTWTTSNGLGSANLLIELLHTNFAVGNTRSQFSSLLQTKQQMKLPYYD